MTKSKSMFGFLKVFKKVHQKCSQKDG